MFKDDFPFCLDHDSKSERTGVAYWILNTPWCGKKKCPPSKEVSSIILWSCQSLKSCHNPGNSLPFKVVAIICSQLFLDLSATLFHYTSTGVVLSKGLLRVYRLYFNYSFYFFSGQSFESVMTILPSFRKCVTSLFYIKIEDKAEP